jgi:hypothetical protein
MHTINIALGTYLPGDVTVDAVGLTVFGVHSCDQGVFRDVLEVALWVMLYSKYTCSVK